MRKKLTLVNFLFTKDTVIPTNAEWTWRPASPILWCGRAACRNSPKLSEFVIASPQRGPDDQQLIFGHTNRLTSATDVAVSFAARVDVVENGGAEIWPEMIQVSGEMRAALASKVPDEAKGTEVKAIEQWDVAYWRTLAGSIRNLGVCSSWQEPLRNPVSTALRIIQRLQNRERKNCGPSGNCPHKNGKPALPTV